LPVVHLIGRLVIKGLVVPGLIVMPEVPVARLLQVVSVLEGREVDALVFDAPPEPFHEDVVMVAALAVHADPDAMAFENACEGLTGELDNLIRIDEKVGGRSSPLKQNIAH
jgi:hypothetical protein